MTPFTINNRPIGPDHPPYVVAELSGNHNGELGRALALIEAAAERGADAVKLQTYTADTMTINHDGPDFMIEAGLWKGYKLYDLYREAHTPWEWHEALFAKAAECGIGCFSSPFDETAVDFLEELGVPAYKIASFEVVDLPLIARVGRTGKPTIISTGMASPDEIAEAVATYREAGGGALVLLHCISAYPSPPEQANLRRMLQLGVAHDCAFGLSDHTLGDETAIAAVALGASVIEKHITLARADGGPDAAFSLEPDELSRLCRVMRTTHAALGKGSVERSPVEAGSMVFRRSIYAVADIAEGERFTRDNVRIIRPGYGLAPREMPRVLGARARWAISRGSAIEAPMIAAP